MVDFDDPAVREACLNAYRMYEAMKALPPPTPLTLAGYLEQIDGVPIPTPEQRARFAEFVSRAHSWYKHLPRFLPGVPFYFFLDRYAGFDREIRTNEDGVLDGSGAMVPRAEQGFHCSAIPTEDYRSRYGHLAYSASAGSSAGSIGTSSMRAATDKVAAIHDEQARPHGVPAEILCAGEVWITAFVHRRCAIFHYWDLGRDARELDAREVEWPEESGGRPTLERVFARCRRMRHPNHRVEQFFREVCETDPGPGVGDEELHALIAPERERQLREMVAAIDRVCAWIEQHRA
jgi:hypothetical protein